MNHDDIIRSMAGDILHSLKEEGTPTRISSVVLATALSDLINSSVEPKSRNEVTLYSVKLILQNTGLLTKTNRIEFSL